MTRPASPYRSQQVYRYQDGQLLLQEQAVSEEMALTVYVNGKEIVTMLCSPQQQTELALGFLLSEGIVGTLPDIETLHNDTERGLVWVEAAGVSPGSERQYVKRCLTACCGRGRAEFYFANDARQTRFNNSEQCFTAADIGRYAALLEEASATHRLTHGVHSGAIAGNGRLWLYAEDIGRHNVFDKLYGASVQQQLPLSDKLIIFSGRVSSEILLKTAKMGLPLVAGRSAPTTLAIGLAEELGITLLGAVRNGQFTVYTQAQRVTAG